MSTTDDLVFSADGETWVEFGPPGHRRRVGFHDYAAIYAEPGLYERMFYETLGMRSTAEVVRMYADEIVRAGRNPASERVVDFGAGNGLGGIDLRELGIGTLIGVDLEPMARVAAERDRPGVYDDYLVGDVGAWSEAELQALRDHEPTAVLALSAVGIGHISPQTLARALTVLGPGGLYGFAVTPTLLPGTTHEGGLASGFPDYLPRLQRETDVLLERTYVHRIRTDGTEELATAFLGRIR